MLQYVFGILILPFAALFFIVMNTVTLDNSCSVVNEVQRNTDSDIEEEMLSLAENHYPPREEIAAVYELGEMPDSEPVWWYSGYGVRFPYAITAEAVAYYQNLADGFECECSPGCLGKTCTNLFFEYTADVAYYEEYVYQESRYFEGESSNTDVLYQDVYVVEMSLNWGEVYGPLAGYGFGKWRTIIIKSDRTIVGRYGDGIVEDTWVAK